MVLKKLFLPVIVIALAVLFMIPVFREPVHAETEVQDLGNVTIDFRNTDRIVYKGETLETGKRIMDALYAANKNGLVRRQSPSDDVYQLDLDRDDSWDIRYIYNGGHESGEEHITFIKEETCSVPLTSTVTLNAAAMQDAGESTGKSYSSITFLIAEKSVTIKTQPQDATVYAGETVTFLVEAEGDGLKYRWMESVDNGEYWHVCQEPGNTTPKLEFTATMEHTGNLYRCEIVDENDVTYKTDKALLTVVVKPKDIGPYTLDLSGEPYKASVNTDSAQYLRLAVFLFAFGNENPEYTHMEGAGPDLILLDLDMNKSWDLQASLSADASGNPIIIYQPAEGCSIEGSITVTAKDMEAFAENFAMQDYYGTITFVMSTVANPLLVKGKTAKVRYSKLKKKAQTLKVSKVIQFVTPGEGAMSYKKVSGNKKITINKKTGKVTVKKGLKKGTYKVKVSVQAAGGDGFYPSELKPVTFKVKVQ